MIKRFRYIFHAHESISLISILICLILFSIIFQGSLYSVSADMRKTFTPRISIYEQYYDNIDLISNLVLDTLEKNSDWHTMLSPGFSLDLDSPKTKMRLDYEIRVGFYHREKNKERDTDLHYGTAQWEQTLTRNIKLDIMDTFSRSDDPILVNEEGLIEEAVGRRIYYRNNGQISLSMHFGVNNLFGLGYRNLYLNNKSDSYEDSIGHDFFFKLNTRLNPSWGIDLESRINRGKFKQPEGFTGSGTDDFYDREGVITLNYRWHPYRSLFARYSFLSKKFDDPNSIEFYLHQSSVGLSFELSPHTSFSMEGGYFLQDLADNRKEDGARFNIVLNTQKRRASVSLGGSGGFTQDYFSSENLGSSKFRHVYGSLNYLLSRDLSTFLSANYQWNKSLEANQGNRKDKVWRTSTGFYYSFSDWLTLFMDWAYSERQTKSNLRFNRRAEFFRDNRVTLRLTAAYPAIF